MAVLNLGSGDRVGLITYDHPHLKTEQVTRRIASKPYRYEMYALPFVSRPSRKVGFFHRPDQTVAPHPGHVAATYGMRYVCCENASEMPPDCDVYLVLGAGLLPADFVSGKAIINCHPGIIPISRGLDAFKWALFDRKPLGVTLHYIDADVDSGEVVRVAETPVFRSDCMASLARRHYEVEIDLLSDFDSCISKPSNPYRESVKGEVRRRMPSSLEANLADSFFAYKEEYAQ